MIKNICVFASSCNFLDEIYRIDAKKLGFLMAKEGYNLIYGGSSLGLMWMCAKEVKENGRKITGIMPEKLKEMAENSDSCDEFYVTKGMRERKGLMDEMSDAIIALPGGFGTLEELSEMIVQKQLGYNQKAIVILNTNSFYNHLLKFFDEIFEQKFANKKARNLYYVADDADDAIEYLKNYKPQNLAITKEEIYSR